MCVFPDTMSLVFRNLIFNLLFIDDRFAETIDLDVTDPVAHKHIPYVLILVKMAEEWSKSHDGKLPSTREEKKEFKVCLLDSYIFCSFLFLHLLSSNMIFFPCGLEFVRSISKLG